LKKKGLLPVGENVLVAFDGGERDMFDTTLLFRPPFGPYLRELKETFPSGLPRSRSGTSPWSGRAA
jgi:hypothetical protein